MRYVDIDDVELPPDWDALATQALNELRQEILDAETSARAEGKNHDDISKARRKAITEGTERAVRQKIWRSLAASLKKLSNDKCWYSESRNPTADKNVDHFRPKNAVAEDPTHEGYWWLAFSLNNFRYASQWCNQRRNDKESKTSGGKWFHFPLSPGSFRARLEEDDIGREEVELLDPIDPEDWTLLTFRPDGQPTPARPEGTREYVRAEVSIRIYHLHCAELVRERKALFGEIERLIEEMERLQRRPVDYEVRRFYKRQLKVLIKKIRRDAEYSAAAMTYARSQVYKLERGQVVKRTWLEEILNSNS